MSDPKGINFKEVFIMGVSIAGALIIVVFLILVGWFLIWKLFLIRFSFIRELVYGSEDTASKETQQSSSAADSKTALRRSSRLRERQSKNQHGS